MTQPQINKHLQICQEEEVGPVKKAPGDLAYGTSAHYSRFGLRASARYSRLGLRASAWGLLPRDLA